MISKTLRFSELQLMDQVSSEQSQDRTYPRENQIHTIFDFLEVRQISKLMSIPYKTAHLVDHRIPNFNVLLLEIHLSRSGLLDETRVRTA